MTKPKSSEFEKWFKRYFVCPTSLITKRDQFELRAAFNAGRRVERRKKKAPVIRLPSCECCTKPIPPGTGVLTSDDIDLCDHCAKTLRSVDSRKKIVSKLKAKGKLG